MKRWGLWGAIAAVAVAAGLFAQSPGGRGLLFQARFNAGTQNAVDRTAYDKIKDWISVKDYGAKGTGVDNDEVAVQQAITNAGGLGGTQLLQLPCPGSYKTTTYGTLDCGVYYPPVNSTGAVLRSVSNKLLDTVSALDFGADRTGTTDSRAAIQNAINYLSSGGTLLFPAGTYKVDTTTPLTVSTSGINFIGSGVGNTVISVIGTGDLIDLSSTFFKLRAMTLQVTTTSNRGSSALLNITTGSAQGRVDDVRIVGKAGSPNNGIAFKEEQTGSGVWTYDHVDVASSAGPVTWKSAWRLYSNSGTNAVHTLSHIVVSDFTATDAVVDVDTLIDSLIISDSVMVPVGRALWFRNTGSVSIGSYPRWVRISNFYAESGSTSSGVADVQIDSGRDIRFTNCYFGTSEQGLVVSANATEISVMQSVFINIGKQAVDLQNITVNDVTIAGNSFLDIGNTTNNTYDTVQVAAGVGRFKILHNTFNDTGSNKSRYHIAMGAGSGDNFIIGFNDFLTAGATQNIKNNATGVVRTLYGNTGETSSLGDLLSIDNGVAGDGAGFKHKRSVGGCTTAASIGATCTTTFSWGTAFRDANYTVTCFGAGLDSGVPLIQAYTAKAAASTTVQTVALTASAAKFANIECIAVHD